MSSQIICDKEERYMKDKKRQVIKRGDRWVIDTEVRDRAEEAHQLGHRLSARHSLAPGKV